MNPESHSALEAMAPPRQPRDPDASRERSSSYGLLDSLRRRFRLAAVLVLGAASSACGIGIATVKDTKRYTVWEETGQEAKIRTIKTPPKVLLETGIQSSDKGPILVVRASQYGEYQMVRTAEEEEIEHIEQEGEGIGKEYLAAGSVCVLAPFLGPGGVVTFGMGTYLLGHATYKAIEAIDEEDETGQKRLQRTVLKRKPYKEVLVGAPILLQTPRGNFSLGMTDSSGRLRADLKTAIPPATLLAIIDVPAYLTAQPEQQLDLSGIQRSRQTQFNASDWYDPANPFFADPVKAEFIDACAEEQRMIKVQIVRILQFDSSPVKSRYRAKVTLEDGKTIECGATGEQLNLDRTQREAILRHASELGHTVEEVKKWKQIRFEARLKSREIARLDLKEIFLSPEELAAYEKYQNEKNSEEKFKLGLRFLPKYPQSPVNKQILIWLKEHAEEHFFGTAEIVESKTVRCQQVGDYQLQAGEMVFVDEAWSSFDRPEIATMLKIMPLDGACSILLTDKDDLIIVRDLRNFPGGKFTIPKPNKWQLLQRTKSEIDAHLSELGLAGLDTGEIFQRLVRWIIKHGSSTTASSSTADSAIITKGDFPKILCADSLKVEHLPIKDGDLQKCALFGYSCLCTAAPCNLPVGPGTYKVTLKRTGCGPRREEKYEVKINQGEIMTITPPW